MATPGELIKAVADVLHVPEVTISSYYRSLREAGFVTKGGRGRSAAQMTAADAAHLLMAVGGNRFEKESAAKIAEDYRRIRASHTVRRMALPTGERPGWLEGDWIENDAGTWLFEGFSIPHLQALPEQHQFIDALTAVIEAAMNKEFGLATYEGSPDAAVSHIIEIYFYGPEPHAGIEIGLSGGGHFFYTEEGTYQLPEKIGRDPHRSYREVDEEVSREYGSGDLEIRRKITFKTIYEIAELLKS